MDKEQVIEIVRAYKQAIQGIVENPQVYLYGSYSKGTAHKDSDIDIAVVLPEIKGDWFNTSASLWGATRSVNTSIEPVLLDASNPSPLYDDVMRTGIMIH